MKRLSASGLLLAATLACAAPAPDETYLYFSPHPAKPERVRLQRDLVQWRLENQYFEQGPRLPGEPYPLLVGTEKQIQELNQTRATPVKTYGELRGYDAFFPKSPFVPLNAKGVIVVTNDYHDEEDVDLLLTQFATNFPALAQKIQIGSTHLGRAIWALKISDNVAVDEPEPRVVIDANIHGNEHPGTEVALDIIWQLLYGYTNNATFAAWVDGMEIYVIPCLNPDGRFLCDSSGNTWRKNGRHNSTNRLLRYPNDGVDLNRNSSFDWNTGTSGSSTSPGGVTYRGPSPGSEPEIQAYDALLQRVRPGFTLSFHTSWGVFYGPYGNTNVAMPAPDPFKSLGANIARVSTNEDGSAYIFASGHEFATMPDGYSVRGDRVDANYGLYGILAFGVEVGVGDQRPDDYTLVRDELVPGLRLGWQRFLAAAHTNWPKLRGWSQDADTGQPAPVRIHSLNLTNRPNDEHWTSRSDGFYECPLPTAGTYRIVFTPIGQPSLAVTQTLAVGSSALSTNLSFDVAPIFGSIAADGVLAWSNQNEHGLALLESAEAPGGPWLPLLPVSTASRTGQVQMPDVGSTRLVRLRTSPRHFFPATNMICTNMVWIPSGAFQMGDDLSNFTNERPAAAIPLDGFAIDANEVTFSNWTRVRIWATNNGYSFAAGQRGVVSGGGAAASSNHPVVKVSWHDAVKWCNARSQYEGLLPAYYGTAAQTYIYKSNTVDLTSACVNWAANGYRLPTEAEWEKAARGGFTGQEHPWGGGIAASNALYDVTRGTTNVASYPANGYGLFDAAGNAAEWCWDWSGSYADRTSENPIGPTSGTFRVVRGGSWSNDASRLRCAFRDGLAPGSSNTVIGLRCVRR
ncbi:MAG: hypothetical protein EOM72_12205 [Opitutae bacterium]|nr:hypothetical protein [Opitutae bacterium]